MIYLDNAATSFPKPEPVYQALDRFARTSLANPGRAGHRMAVAAERMLDEARHRLNRLFEGEAPERWILTLNCTDGLNLAIKGLVRPGDHVITTDLEHNSVSRPLRALEKAGVIRLTRVASSEGYVRAADIAAALTDATTLVAMTHASNVLGTVQPIEEVASAVRAAGALFLVDAAQSAGVVPISLKELPIDLIAFPGHKALYGPTGTGALYAGPRTDGKLRPWREGGTGGDSSSEVQPVLLPYYLEGGTPNVLGVAGLVAGLTWVEEKGPDGLRAHEVELLQEVVDWVERAEGWGVAGRWDPARHVGALSLRVPEGLTPQDIGSVLDVSFDIAVRPGLHCAPYIHRALGTFPDGTLRLSPGPFSTRQDVQHLIGALGEITASIL
ncbi:putative cysteine desulfurase [Aquisphaera giovannonii]|uniref:cysteine desulfurase n=1 Tax=Aquisphaera giovannonii TaxID=406548 RepID=A0A5B9W088_9BACT|nr:aminotransferase class V-fold PLP-dependent enzyme [Aquisphaera giovannonii]QEH33933.1 putative cysteine desulfurase [Aquisphaera giovannonii]